MPKRRLRDEVREILRIKNYSYRTEISSISKKATSLANFSFFGRNLSPSQFLMESSDTFSNRAKSRCDNFFS